MDASSLQEKADELWAKIKDLEVPDVTAGKTCNEIIEDILEHEKATTGIDWKAAAAGGPTAMKAAKKQALDHLNSLKSKLTAHESKKAIEIGLLQANGDIHPNCMAMFAEEDPDVAPIPETAAPFMVWGWKPESAKKFSDAKGGKIKDLIVNLTRNFQVLKNSDAGVYITKQLMEMGLWGFGMYGLAKVYEILKIAATITEATEAYAVLEGIMDISLAVIKLGITVVILAVIVPLFILMSKDAAGIMVLINDTDQDQILQELECTHGKVIAIFKEKAQLEDPKPIIPKRIPPIVDPKTHKVKAEGAILAGFFSARKRDLALIGTTGALKFKATDSFPKGAFVGWSVPLSQGKNSLLVSGEFEGSVSKFSDNTDSHGKQEDTSTGAANANITGRVNSGSGSQAYYVVSFQSQ